MSRRIVCPHPPGAVEETLGGVLKSLGNFSAAGETQRSWRKRFDSAHGELSQADLGERPRACKKVSVSGSGRRRLAALLQRRTGRDDPSARSDSFASESRIPAAGSEHSPATTEDPSGRFAPEDIVVSLYRALLRREPDPGGFEAYVAALNCGNTLEDLLGVFIRSDEFRKSVDPKFARRLKKSLPLVFSAFRESRTRSSTRLSSVPGPDTAIFRTITGWRSERPSSRQTGVM